MVLNKNKSNNHIGKSISSSETVTIIEPEAGWQLVNIKELREYRDLFFSLFSVKSRFRNIINFKVF